MFENIMAALQKIWGHKMRSLLTMLGIIGIVSIITIVSTIKGTNEQIKQNLIVAGNNVAMSFNSTNVDRDIYQYEAYDLLQQAADLQRLSEATNNQLLWIAGISLLVGNSTIYKLKISYDIVVAYFCLVIYDALPRFVF